MNNIHLPLLAVEGFSQFSDALNSLWSEIWKILLPIGIILLVAYGILVAVTWATAGDEAKQKAAKKRIAYYTAGIVLIFVILTGVPMLIAGLSDWSDQNQLSAVISFLV